MIAAAPSAKARPGWPWAAIVTAAAVVVSLPLFVCEPLWVDANFYATAARVVLNSGVLECDLLYIFPPAMVWIRLLTEGALGGRSEWVRAIDVAWMAATFWLLARWGGGKVFGRGRWWIFWTLLLLYIGTPTNCHAQPDTWMLLPTVVALHLRRRQTARLCDAGTRARALMLAAAVEGFIGATACLFKPHAIVPLAAIVLGGWLIARRNGCTSAVRLGADLAGWLFGGALVFAGWMTWLAADGGWTCFWANLADWGGGYNSQRPALSIRLYYLFVLMPVWSFLHAPMLVLAARALWRVAPWRKTGPVDLDASESALYAAFYVAWAAEGTLLQWGHHYQFLPALLVASRWFGGWVLSWPDQWQRWAMATIVAMAVVADPLLMPWRLSWWGICCREGATPVVLDALTMPARYPPHIHLAFERTTNAEAPIDDGQPSEAIPMELSHRLVAWQDLDRVADFLRQQGIRNGELTCYHTTTAYLFSQLGVRPATRWVWPEMAVHFYPDRELQIRRELAESGQRFVVSDLQNAAAFRLGPSQPTPSGWTLPNDFPAEFAGKFPWHQPIVFRAGRYAVHRVELPLAELTPDLVPRH